MRECRYDFKALGSTDEAYVKFELAARRRGVIASEYYGVWQFQALRLECKCREVCRFLSDEPAGRRAWRRARNEVLFRGLV